MIFRRYALVNGGEKGQILLEENYYYKDIIYVYELYFRSNKSIYR